MKNKKTFSIGNLLFLRGSAFPSSNAYEAVLQSTRERSFRFVPKARAEKLVHEHHAELSENGCSHLIGADGNLIWWYDFSASSFDYNDLEFHPSEGVTLGTLSNDGEAWFVLELLADPFEIVTLEIPTSKHASPTTYRAAIARSWSKTETPASLLDRLALAGLEPDGKVGLELVNEVGGLSSTRAWWRCLENEYGPLFGIICLDSELLAYLGHSIDFSFCGANDESDEYFVYERLGYYSGLEGLVIPLARED